MSKTLSDELGEDFKHVERYLKRLELNYKAVYALFIQTSLHRIRHWLNRNVINAVYRIPFYGLFSSMNRINSRSFKNSKTTQIFNRFATYNGSDPYRSPGMFNIISHLELNVGPFMPKGGMVSISNVVYKKAIELGVQFHFESRIDEILHSNGMVKGVTCAGQMHESDIIVSNMDIHFTHEKLLPGLKGPPKSTKTRKVFVCDCFLLGHPKVI